MAGGAQRRAGGTRDVAGGAQRQVGSTWDGQAALDNRQPEDWAGDDLGGRGWTLLPISPRRLQDGDAGAAGDGLRLK
jgi:hypothetical protein